MPIWILEFPWGLKLSHNPVELNLIYFSYRLREVSEILILSHKFTVNCFCFIVAHCPRKHIILRNIAKASLWVFVQEHQILKIRNYTFLPEFNVNVDILWINFLFFFNLLTETVPLLGISEHKKVTSVGRINLDWILNLQVAFLDELIFILIKLNQKGKRSLLNVTFFSLFWLQGHETTVYLRVDILILDEFTQKIIVNSQFSLVELGACDVSHLKRIDVTVNSSLWWPKLRWVWHCFYLLWVANLFHSSQVFQNTLEIISIFDTLWILYRHFR